jgi:hypothetical protein
VVTIYTTLFNVNKFCIFPSIYICILYGSQNKLEILGVIYKVKERMLNIEVMSVHLSVSYC